MPAKTSHAAPATRVHPSLGTLIDDDSLELVEVLGVGGYGVVYRAVDTRSSCPKSYAVKCLMHSQPHVTARQRQLHIREIALHQIAGAHPNVVTLHRVIEDLLYTYIVMDFAPDHDLFSQILHGCRYLGNDRLIKHIFMQMLDAVEYCHSLGIYHRDLKPENVLCFDGGLRIAITDFGLATTDKISEEFRTGSVYHMSPECQGGEFARTGAYSPMFNDIWSLGIILLNIVTGRNPWKSASLSDSTFQAYLRDPDQFLMAVLPISPELNAVLTRMLELDWQNRMTLPELRLAMEDLDNFYSEGVIFEGSMARCPWEAGMEIDSGSSTKDNSPRGKSMQDDLKSCWSKDSEIVFAPHSAVGDSTYGTDFSSSACATWAFDSASSTDSEHILHSEYIFESPRTPPSAHSRVSSTACSGSFGSPATPGSINLTFRHKDRNPLTIDTNCSQPRYYTANSSMTSFSTSCVMQTAVEEYEHYSPSFFLSTPGSPEKRGVSSPMAHSISPSAKDEEMTSPSIWEYSTAEMSRYSSTQSSIVSARETQSFDRSLSPSPEALPWPDSARALSPSECSPSAYDMVTDTPTSPHGHRPGKTLHTDGVSTLFYPIKFFPRGPTSTFTKEVPHLQPLSEPFQSFVFSQTQTSPSLETWPAYSSTATTTVGLSSLQQQQDRSGGSTGNCRKAAAVAAATRTPRHPHHWFLPGKLFASAGTAS